MIETILIGVIAGIVGGLLAKKMRVEYAAVLQMAIMLCVCITAVYEFGFRYRELDAPLSAAFYLFVSATSAAPLMFFASLYRASINKSES